MEFEVFAVAPLVTPVIVFATENTWVASPIVPEKLSRWPSGRALAEPYFAVSVEEVFPVTFEINIVATLLIVLVANTTVPQLFAPSFTVSPIWNAPFAARSINLVAGLTTADTSCSLNHTYTLVRGWSPLAVNWIVCPLTYGTTVLSITLFPTVLRIASGGVLALIPTRDLELFNSEVLLFAFVVFPVLSTLNSGDSVSCLPVQLVLQSSYWDPNPNLPVDGLSAQLSLWPSKFVVTSGRLFWENQVSEAGNVFILPTKFTILNGLIFVVPLANGCWIKSVSVYGKVTMSPVFVTLLLYVESNVNLWLS